MRSKDLLKEKTAHGTLISPIAIHHLSYENGLEDFFYLHWHDELEFVVVLEGNILYTYNDLQIPIKKGEGLFLLPNTLHAASSLNGSSCEACVLLFHPSIFGNPQKEDLYSRFVYPILHSGLKINPFLTPENTWQKQVLTLLQEIDQNREATLIENELWLRSRIYAIWHYCYQNAQENQLTLTNKQNYKMERMEIVLQFMEEHYQEDIRLRDLATLLPMSEGQFCRTFKEVTNYTPIAYLIHLRILKACILLTTSNTKIADIARSTGFSNISYFNREFIKAVHCTPSQYRKEG